jgi:putative heme-binding domain-containing protein
MQSRAILFLMTVCLVWLPPAQAQVAPWADPSLPVRDGMVLWLDASAEPRARQVEGLPLLVAGATSGVWHDASGRSPHLVQRLAPSQPRFVAAGDRAAFRFDGRDDHFAVSGPARELSEFSLFVVAAPRSNPGGFSALIAANALGRNDYHTGFTIDQSFPATGQLETLNAEGAGFGGARDLLDGTLPFGIHHTFEVHARAGSNGVALLLDGQDQGRRDRQTGRLRLDEITVGARFYSNEAAPPFVQGFFDGTIAEVVLYGRALTEAEARSVREYLRNKYSEFDADLARAEQASGRSLRTATDPPPVQVLVPGFEVRELPLLLPNLNNVRYRADGKLVGLAYNGDVYLLTDRDGDGLEDRADKFWDNRGRIRAPIGMALTPPGYRLGQGLFVASKGKCSLIVDTDQDDIADKEIVVAQGWEEIAHGVDALGVALAPDGSVYFGIGSADYANAYQLDPQGQPHYDPQARAVVLRVSPDFSAREVVATGVRFPVALAFNRAGDLFATDQEGATWLPNGNPFDELLHIRHGRHYGFPPRHSRFLPAVIDEPSVFDYAPQHQSTCGLVFNEPVNGGPIFGPGGWRGDALVCGYSRGKLFRTEVVPTAAGYVARNQVLACLGMLTVDACVGPEGSLTVATHSGGPDWGSGPDGTGKLYQLRLADPAVPQPVFAWPESSREVRIAFDRPLEADRLRGLAEGTALARGSAVTAGERFETLRPGYAVVRNQVLSPRFDVALHSRNVTPDRRTLLIATEADVEAVPHALTLPGLGRPARGDTGHGLPQEPAIDLAYDLSGVRAAWREAEGHEAWSGWLPHLDLEVARTLTAGSAEHDRLWAGVERAGRLELSGQLDLRDMLRPAVQPGSRVDDVLRPERVTIVLEASGPMDLRAAGRAVRSARGPNDRHRIALELQAGLTKDWVPFTLTLERVVHPSIAVSWFTAEDTRPRSLPLRRMLVPWARTASSAEEAASSSELAGGDWSRGRALFFGQTARCSQCHTIHGEGGKIGPDLSNLSHRDYESVLRDIRDPGFAINPDYITYLLALSDGRVLQGPLRTQGEQLLVGDTEGHVTAVARADVDEIRPSPASAMPVGLADAIGAEALRDLLCFLLAPDLEPAPIHRTDAPQPRSREEVERVLRAVPALDEGQARRPLKVALMAGEKDHGIDEHDYPLWQRRWAELLGRSEGVTVRTAQGWPDDATLGWADIVVMYSANPGWSDEKAPGLDAFLERGGGVVLLHYAVNGRKAPEALAERIGLAWRDGASRFRHGPVELTFAAEAKSAIAAGLTNLALVDESYWELVGDPKRVEVLASATEDGRPRPMIWTRHAVRGRVVGCVLGHYSWTFDDPLFRILVLRAMAWSAGEPVARLQALATIGARLR